MSSWRPESRSCPPKIRQIIGALRALLEGRRDDAVAGILAITNGDFRDAEGLYYLARELAHAGATDEAIAVLQRVCAAGFHCYPLIATDEWLDPIRDRAEFAEMLQRVRHEHELAATAFAAAGGTRVS